MAEERKGSRSWIVAGLVIGAASLGLFIYISTQSGDIREGNGTTASQQRYPVSVGEAPTKGPADALVTLIEFSDFQCPHCRQASLTVAQLSERFPDDLRVAFRHSPLSQAHPHARVAAAASLAAHEQGQFWEFHDALFDRQAEFGRRGPAMFTPMAKQLQLDVIRFETDMHSARLDRRVRDDRRQLIRLGSGVVPTFFINGRRLIGAQPLERFQSLVEEELRHARTVLEKGTPREELYETIVNLSEDQGPQPAPSGPPAAESVDNVDEGPACGATPRDATPGCGDAG